MDTFVITPPPDPKCEPEPFQNLKVLGVGLSPLLSSAPTVASLLSAVLPKECALSYTYDERLSRDIAQEKYDKWEPVMMLIAEPRKRLRGEYFACSLL